MFGATAPLHTEQIDIADLEQALIAGMILCYAQGFAMTTAATQDFGWVIDLPGVAASGARAASSDHRC